MGNTVLQYSTVKWGGFTSQVNHLGYCLLSMENVTGNWLACTNR